MKQVSKASQLNKSVKQVSLASQVKQVGLASQVSNLPKSSQESEIKKVLVKQVQVKQVKSSKFKLSNLNQASEVMLDRDTAPRKRPSTRLSGKTASLQFYVFFATEKLLDPSWWDVIVSKQPPSVQQNMHGLIEASFSRQHFQYHSGLKIQYRSLLCAILGKFLIQYIIHNLKCLGKFCWDPLIRPSIWRSLRAIPCPVEILGTFWCCNELLQRTWRRTFLKFQKVFKEVP